jgi:hypothetical protein
VEPYARTDTPNHRQAYDTSYVFTYNKFAYVDAANA